MQKNEGQKFMLRFVAMGCQVVYYECNLWRYHGAFVILVSEYNDVGLGDAYHITQPHADGRGAVLAMNRALGQVSS